MSFSGGAAPPIFWVWRRDTVNNCHEYNMAVLNYIKSNSNLEYIILSGRWTVYVERHRFNNREGGIEDGNDIILDIINNGTLEINTE